MKKSWIVFLLVLFISIVGCSKKAEQENADDAEKIELNPPEKIEEVDYHIYPFTGKKTTEDISHRAVAVMVSNQIQARPQTGVSKADIVFEMLTEGNITRYMAIFHSQFPEAVGPVRSAREYFFTLADSYNALYVYSGAANFVNDMIYNRGIEHFQGDYYSPNGPLLIREDFRVTPHNLYLQLGSGAIYDEAEKKEYAIEAEYEPMLFLDEDESVEDGEPANFARIDYYGGTPVMTFKYDETTEKYIQFMDGDQTRELETDEPIQIDNLFIVESHHEQIDEMLRRHIDIASGGNGYLLQKGKVQEVEWENQDGRIIPVKNGEVVPLVPGQTWISFVQIKPEPGVVEQVRIGYEE